MTLSWLEAPEAASLISGRLVFTLSMVEPRFCFLMSGEGCGQLLEAAEILDPWFPFSIFKFSHSNSNISASNCSYPLEGPLTPLHPSPLLEPTSMIQDNAHTFRSIDQGL
ncbi:hypothetical protein H1C71_029899 [Ictidomys tridecemlineatus]|nr:hypothetical protein H1C71_029899 [Ictidomys tridecemlineatus]